MTGENKIIVRQTRSAIGRNGRVRDTLKALGLGRIGAERQLVASASVMGMIAKVSHIVKVYNIQ